MGEAEHGHVVLERHVRGRAPLRKCGPAAASLISRSVSEDRPERNALPVSPGPRALPESETPGGKTRRGFCCVAVRFDRSYCLSAPNAPTMRPLALNSE